MSEADEHAESIPARARRRLLLPRLASPGYAFYFLFVGSLIVVAARREPWALEYEFPNAYFPVTVNCVTPFSPDGRFLLTTALDRVIRVLDLRTGREVCALKGHVTSGVRCASFSPDGRRVVTTCGDGARVWDAKTGEVVAELRKPGVWHAAFSPGGKLVGCGVTVTPQNPKRHDAYLWDADTGPVCHVLKGHRGDIKHPAFSPDGRFFLTGSNQGMVRLWEVRTGALVWDVKRGASLNGVRVAPDGAKALGVFDDYAYVLDMKDGSILIALPTQSYPIRIGSFSPDGRRIVTGDFGGEARVWDASTGEPVCRLSGPFGVLNSACFSPDGTRAATAAEPESHVPAVYAEGPLPPRAPGDRCVRIWDADRGELLWVSPGHGGMAVPSAFFGPRGRRLVTGCDPVRVWYRRRPEWWWGHFLRPEVWAAIFFGYLWLWRVAVWGMRKVRARPARGREAAPSP